MPELTCKAILLAIILAAVLGAANVYLALKLGQTIAVSIPAAMIAMSTLRLFKQHNILENNIVQTGASAGGAIAAAISFTLPTLLIMGYWQNFPYWETVLIIAVSGLIGVFFSIPLRRILLNYPNLHFPEGTAIGNVLQASQNDGIKMHRLIQGGLTGASIVILQTGFKILADSLQLWTVIKGKILFGLGLGFSPTLLGAGFIVGIQACISMFIGFVLAWYLALPLLSLHYGIPQADNCYAMVTALRNDHIRYMGVGTMLIGGIWTLVNLIKPITLGIFSSIQALKLPTSQPAGLLKVQDIPLSYMSVCLLALLVMAYGVLSYFFPDISATIPFLIVLFVIVVGFLGAAVCAYLSGLVGTTNNPLSALLLCCVFLTSALAMLFLKQQAPLIKIGMVLIVISLLANIMIISGENIQDLKAGQIVGATPWKQQLIMIIGVIVSSLVFGPVLQLLYTAYGIGGVFPRPGMSSTQMLTAPQAGLIAAITQAALDRNLPLRDISIGAGIGIIAGLIDEYLRRSSGKRLVILGIGIGLYLPPEIISAIVLGGVIKYLCQRKLGPHSVPEAGIMLACGLVAGAALAGVLLAVPFVLLGSSDALRLVPTSFEPFAAGIGLITILSIGVWLYKSRR